MRKLRDEKLFTQLGHEDKWDCPLRGDQHLSCREAIHPRHQDVAHHDIGIKTERRLNQFVSIANSSDDLIAVAEELNDYAPECVVVIRNEHSQPLHDDCWGYMRSQIRVVAPEQGIENFQDQEP